MLLIIVSDFQAWIQGKEEVAFYLTSLLLTEYACVLASFLENICLKGNIEELIDIYRAQAIVVGPMRSLLNFLTVSPFKQSHKTNYWFHSLNKKADHKRNLNWFIYRRVLWSW